MNAARRAARAGRNLLLAVLVGGLIVVAIVVAYVAGGNASGPSPGSSGANGSTPVPTGRETAADVAPTGCFGGSSLDSAMLLRAQAEAPRTTFGAVEVAAAFFRWGYRYPPPSNSEISRVAALFPESGRADAQRSLRASYRQNPNPASGVVTDGMAFQLSTVSGSWLASAEGKDDDVTVSVQAAMVIDGALSPTKTSAEAFSMTWESGGWRIVRFDAADTAGLQAGGTAFTAGC